MNAPLMPPASPHDALRPATAADIAANAVTHAAWLDYANDLQQRAAQRSQRAALRQLATEAPRAVTARVDAPVITDAPPIYVTAWEQRGTNDARPTFAEAIDAYCAAHHTSIQQLGKQHGVDPSFAYRVRLCTAIAGPYTRKKWSEILWMRPSSIRWPITKRNEAQS